MGSACRGGVEIRGENVDIFKLGPYSYWDQKHAR